MRDEARAAREQREALAAMPPTAEEEATRSEEFYHWYSNEYLKAAAKYERFHAMAEAYRQNLPKDRPLTPEERAHLDTVSTIENNLRRDKDNVRAGRDQAWVDALNAKARQQGLAAMPYMPPLSADRRAAIVTGLEAEAKSGRIAGETTEEYRRRMEAEWGEEQLTAGTETELSRLRRKGRRELEGK
jgi:hypothetical protein